MDVCTVQYVLAVNEGGNFRHSSQHTLNRVSAIGAIRCSDFVPPWQSQQVGAGLSSSRGRGCSPPAPIRVGQLRLLPGLSRFQFTAADARILRVWHVHEEQPLLSRSRLPAPPTSAAPAVVGSWSVAPSPIGGRIIRISRPRIVYWRRVIVSVGWPRIVSIAIPVATTTPTIPIAVVAPTCTCWRATQSKDCENEGQTGESEPSEHLATPIEVPAKLTRNHDAV
jgi:hypothetical protein